MPGPTSTRIAVREERALLAARPDEGLDAEVAPGVVDPVRPRRLEPEADLAERREVAHADGVLGLDQRGALHELDEPVAVRARRSRASRASCAEVRGGRDSTFSRMPEISAGGASTTVYVSPPM